MYMGTVWKAPAGKTTFVSTKKELPPQASNEDLACWVLAEHISDTFGEEPATVADIYYKVTRSSGLSSSETSQLVRGAKKAGYLESA